MSLVGQAQPLRSHGSNSKLGKAGLEPHTRLSLKPSYDSYHSLPGHLSRDLSHPIHVFHTPSFGENRACAAQPQKQGGGGGWARRTGCEKSHKSYALDLLRPIAHDQKALLMVRRSLKHNGALERGGLGGARPPPRICKRNRARTCGSSHLISTRPHLAFPVHHRFCHISTYLRHPPPIW